jgi:NO-binding membrane sensor protein with MHYT domain
MGQIHHFTYGLITPGLAFALSILGSLLGLTCTARVRTAKTLGARAGWLILAAWAIGGTGIWVMHFMAMLGFGVTGADIRYDVPLTAASAVVAIVVVGAGLFIVGMGRPTVVKILFGGLFTGLGVAAMHYMGMAAMHLNGQVDYDPLLVWASIAIAVVAATVALWFTSVLQRASVIVAASVVMGVAVCGMHYTAMAAMSVHLHDASGEPAGATADGLLVPIVLLVIFVVIGLIYSVLAAPTDEDRAGAAYVNKRIADRANAPVAAPPTPGSLRTRRR